MILYHGSNVEVESLRIINNPGRTNDFGAAFYLTTNKQQAAKFAKIVFTRKKNIGAPIINHYWIDDDYLEEINIVKYEAPNEEWIDFVTACRTNREPEMDADIVYGPFADDKVYRVILLYEQGLISKNEAINQMLVKSKYNQYAFKSKEAIAHLKFLKAEEVKND